MTTEQIDENVIPGSGYWNLVIDNTGKVVPNPITDATRVNRNSTAWGESIDLTRKEIAGAIIQAEVILHKLKHLTSRASNTAWIPVKGKKVRLTLLMEYVDDLDSPSSTSKGDV